MKDGRKTWFGVWTLPLVDREEESVNCKHVAVVTCISIMQCIYLYFLCVC